MTFNCPLWFRRWAQLNSRGGSPCNRVPIAFCCGWMCSRKAWFDPSIVIYRRLAPDRIAEMQMHWFSLQTHFGLSFSRPTGRIQPRRYHWCRCKVYLQCVVENPLWKKKSSDPSSAGYGQGILVEVKPELLCASVNRFLLVCKWWLRTLVCSLRLETFLALCCLCPNPTTPGIRLVCLCNTKWYSEIVEAKCFLHGSTFLTSFWNCVFPKHQADSDGLLSDLSFERSLVLKTAFVFFPEHS